MSNNTLDTATLAQLHGNYLASQKQNVPQQPQQKKGNFLTNMLPAIGGGLGAVAGIPLDFLGGAGSIAGGAAGASLGEALKEHLLGQNLSAKQIGIQGVEGGALSAFNPLKALGAASGVAKGFVNSGADAASQIADKTAMEGVDRSANSLANKLVTQGQQAQGRVAGTSAGKVGQVVTTPQDTARYNAILNREKIPIGNANTTLQAVQSKLDKYGKQIGDHFTANNTPLNPADTKTLAANYLTGLKTTDPGVLKQASVLANDLEKNVTDTKSLWEFRKALDTRIPDSKLAAGNNVLSDKMTAIKGLRQHIADQLGDIPGASQYHDLSEVKPLVAGEAQRLNNPGGGVIGRLVASGPAQKTEALVGKATEALGTKLGGKSSATLEGALKQGTENSAPVSNSGSVLRPPVVGETPTVGTFDGALREASNSAGQIGSEAGALPTTSLAAKALMALKGTAALPLRAAAAPLAYPGRSIAQVGKQAIGRGIGDLLTAGGPMPPISQPTDLTGALSQGGQPDQSQQTSQSPYSQEALQYDIKRDPLNAEKYITYYTNLDKIYNPAGASGSTIKPTGQQYGLAQGGVNSLQQLAQLLGNDSSLAAKNQTPGQGLPLVGNLITNGAGVGDYHALADNVLQSLIHLQTGATATPEEVKAAKGQLPGPGDSPEEVHRKLSNLATMFMPYIQGGQIGGTSNSGGLAAALGM